MDYTGIQTISLKTNIKHKHSLLMLNIMQCQCIASKRFCGPSPYIFDIYLLVSGHGLKKTGLQNLEQLLYLFIFWF